MKAHEKFEKIIGGTRYSVEKSTLIAHNYYWDGHNMERNGRNTFLYHTKNGRYFTVNLTQWQGERDTLTPVSTEEAQDLWETCLSEHSVEFEEAFPGVEVKDA